MKFEAKQIIMRRCIVYTSMNNYEVLTKNFAIYMSTVIQNKNLPKASFCFTKLEYTNTYMFKRISAKIFSFARGISSRVNWNIDTFGYALLLVLFTITPIFFLPMLGVTLFTGKIVFVSIVAALALFVYSFAVLARGSISLPRDKTWLLLFGITLVSILSAVFSGALHHNLIGYMGEITTAFFIILFTILVFLGSRFIDSFEKISGIYIAFIGMAALLTVYHIVRFFAGPAFMSFGVIPFTTGSLLGTWNDLAVFFGGALFLNILTLEFLPVRGWVKWFLAISSVVFGLVMLVINFKLVWIILGILALLTALYVFSFAYWDAETKTYKKDSRIPVFTLVLFVVSIIGLLAGPSLNNLASKYSNVSYTEVRPSVVTTAQVGLKSLTKNFVIGTGINSFNTNWELVKPQNISGTQFGQASFQLGFGVIPTFMALSGVVGIILWILFLVVLFYRMVKILTKSFDHPMSRYFTVSLVLLITYMLIFAFMYTISVSLLIMMTVLLGGFFGILRGYGYTDELELWFIKDPRASFFGIIILIAMMLFSVFGGYVILRKFSSLNQFQRGSLQIRQGLTDQGILRINRALALSDNDMYHRELAAMTIGNMTTFLGSDQVKQISQEEVTANAQKLASLAIAHSQAAINYNKFNSDNWVSQGDVFRYMTQIGAADAYDKAIAAYTQAQKRNPKDTTMDLYFAQLQLAKGDTEGAAAKITESINKQPTRDAYLLKYQLALAKKDYPAGFASLRQALSLDQYNAGLYYEYGMLALSRGQNTDAAAAFNQVLTLDRSYVQAYFYLVVALEKADQMDAARDGAEFLRKQNPDTDKILAQIRSGLSGVSPAGATAAPVAETTPANTPVATPKTQ
jgi:tetratricopeptide (TPR) repeat protein